MISLKETDVFITVSQILVKGNTYFIVGIAFDSLFFYAREVGDRVLFVDEGRIIEEGTPKEIFENPKQERTKLFLSKIL